jgi:hypothetical protein
MSGHSMDKFENLKQACEEALAKGTTQVLVPIPLLMEFAKVAATWRDLYHATKLANDGRLN